jgi:hypothetical protein
MDGMSDFRRHGPELQAGVPQIKHTPGLPAETMAELAPFLAEEGIDVNNIDVSDMATLQAAMNRAIERRELLRFTPVGATRQEAATVSTTLAR